MSGIGGADRANVGKGAADSVLGRKADLDSTSLCRALMPPFQKGLSVGLHLLFFFPHFYFPFSFPSSFQDEKDKPTCWCRFTLDLLSSWLLQKWGPEIYCSLWLGHCSAVSLVPGRLLWFGVRVISNRQLFAGLLHGWSPNIDSCPVSGTKNVLILSSI